MDYEMVFREMVKSCSEAGIKLAHERCMSGFHSQMHLYYKASTDKCNGELRLIDDLMAVPAGFVSAEADSLRLDVPFNSYFCWVKNRASRLPVLCTGEPVCA